MRPARRGLAVVVTAWATSACNLDLINPNAPTEAEVLSSSDGLIALSLGMQEQYASSILTYIRAPALLTDEWGTQSLALASDQALFLGTSIDPSFGTVSGPYFATFRIVRSANNLLAAVPGSDLPAPTQTGILATAKLFKAMALGMAIQHYERVPIDADIAGPVPQPRPVVLAEVIRLLESARTDLAGVTDAQLATFRGRALTPQFDLRNTVDAMLARYYLISGQFQQADVAAARVNLNSVSVFTFPTPTRNPIENYAFGARYVAGLRSFVTEAEPGDQRPAFWLNTTATVINSPHTTPATPLLPLRQYSQQNDPYPVYLPTEMLLIRAEAQARLGNLAQARTFINQVRTRTATATSITPGAGLPALTAEQLPTLEAILRQVAYERRYELYMQGLRWEDLRRLGQFAGRQPKATFLPLPEGECQINPNAGC
jgi:hypothetical protein